MTTDASIGTDTGIHRVLICSACYDPAVLKPPRQWSSAWGPPPPYSHADGEPPCAVYTRTGYYTAELKVVEQP